MDALKEWVRSLVMLVLVASCLELLLPMNNMKKYVRLTMGLLVVLSMVNPVVTFLGQSVHVDAQLFSDERATGLPTLGQIMTKANQFREKNQALASQEAQARLGDLARQAAVSVEGVADAKVTVTLTKEASAIREVGVTITPGSRFGAVKPVKPVIIGEEPAAKAGSPGEADGKLMDAVRREVAGRLGLPADPKIVRVQIDRGK